MVGWWPKEKISPSQCRRLEPQSAQHLFCISRNIFTHQKFPPYSACNLYPQNVLLPQYLTEDMWLKFCILQRNKTDIGKGQKEDQSPQDFAFLNLLKHFVQCSWLPIWSNCRWFEPKWILIKKSWFDLSSIDVVSGNPQGRSTPHHT